MLAASVLLLALSTVAAAEIPTFEKNQVVRCLPQTRDHLDFLHEKEWNFWAEPRRLGLPVDIMVTRGENDVEIINILRNAGISCSMMIENVQTLIDKEAEVARNKDVPFLQNYHTYTDVYNYFDQLAASFPSLATIGSLGKTYEGKDIKIITLSSDAKANKPALWFDSGLHAREWITVATMTYVTDSLVRGYGSNGNITQLIDTFDIIICPVANADGYDYTWTGDRMWRKTRSPNDHSSCVGTDPNRNWAFHWGEAGANKVKCSDEYMGPSAASEVEVQAIQSYLCSHGNLKSYVNFHSYSQSWMSPWGYTSDLPPDYDLQNALSKAATDALRSVHGTKFEYGPIATTIYPASGSSADYAYGVCGIVYSYGAELRDTGEYGFLLPADQIVPSGEEILAAVVAMGQFISTH